MKTRYKIGAGILALLVASAMIIFFSPSSIPSSPLGTDRSPFASPPPTEYVILGFAPYWNLKKISPIALESITHFAYFNLHLNGEGSLYTKVNRREEDPGFTNYKRVATHTIDIGNRPLIITFMPESQAALAQSISSPGTRAQTIKTITTTLYESGATGVNIDYEPLGDISPELRNNFTRFIQELKSSLGQSSLSISIYASAASRPRLWDLRELAPVTDYFVVMTYDYTMPSDLKSGPNAPLRGSGQLFEHDIIKNIAQISQIVETRKILLGIPFYGYEWETLDETKYSPATERGSVASLERIQKMLDDQTLELLWDRTTLTPYGVSTTAGQTSQIYFENSTSIALKLAFVKAANLGGIAIWALGYEGDNPELWHSITTSLSSRPGGP